MCVAFRGEIGFLVGYCDYSRGFGEWEKAEFADLGSGNSALLCVLFLCNDQFFMKYNQYTK